MASYLSRWRDVCSYHYLAKSDQSAGSYEKTFLKEFKLTEYSFLIYNWENTVIDTASDRRIMFYLIRLKKAVLTAKHTKNLYIYFCVW